MQKSLKDIEENHVRGNDRLIQVGKQFSDLKQKQKIKIVDKQIK